MPRFSGAKRGLKSGVSCSQIFYFGETLVNLRTPNHDQCPPVLGPYNTNVVQQSTTVETSFEVAISISKRLLDIKIVLYNHCTQHSVNVAAHYADSELILTNGALQELMLILYS